MKKEDLEYIKSTLVLALENNGYDYSGDLYNMACNAANIIDNELVTLGLPSVNKCDCV